MNLETQLKLNTGQPGFYAILSPSRFAERFNCPRWLGLPLILLAAMVFSREARADSMTLSESWSETAANQASDNGTFSASLTVPGLQNFTAETWSNLFIILTTSNLDTGGFGDMMGAANTNGTYGPGSAFTATTATFYLQTLDVSNNPVNGFRLTFTRSGNTLSISGQTIAAASLQPPWSIAAVNYLYDPLNPTNFTPHVVNDPHICDVLILNPDGTTKADFARTMLITETDTTNSDAFGDVLNHSSLCGTTDFTPPTLTAVSPAASLTVTNGLLPVTVKATAPVSIVNVEFYLNGVDIGQGVTGGSNLWSRNFALIPGVNTIQTVATDSQNNVSATNTLTVTYANGQTNANLITFSEHYQDGTVTNFGSPEEITQDTFVLNAALVVPALQNMTANTWSNLIFAINLGQFSFSNSLSAANILTTNAATLIVSQNPAVPGGGFPIIGGQLTLTRVGNKLLVACESGGGLSLVAGSYLGQGGAIKDQMPLNLMLIDGSTSAQYAHLERTVYIMGTNSVANGLNNIQVAGDADYTPPTLTNASPATTSLTTTNGLLELQVRATDVNGVTNVEFSVNGQDLGQGVPGISNLWSQNLAFVPGTNIITTIAVDPSGNISTNNTLTVDYVNTQTNAPLISFSERWLDNNDTNLPAGAHQDAGVLDAALPVPALQTMDATTWSNLVLTFNFGPIHFTNSLNTANFLTTNSATFQYEPTNNPAVFPVPAILNQLVVTRVGGKLLLAFETDNPPNDGIPSIIAESYLYRAYTATDTNLVISDQKSFTLALTDGNTSFQYANTNHIIYITGTNFVTYNSTLNDIRISGAADFIPPTNQITTPIAGQQWSNNTFVVTGKAQDNRAVSNVVYSLNSSDWASVSTGNSFTNWTAPVNLIAGTNTIQAYAIDNDNNNSVTNTVIFRYIPSSTIALSTNGLGTLSPNYAGAMLGISNTYSITASPASGFVFSNWSGSTNTKAATLTFQMQSNLAFTVTFLDVTRPTLGVTNLTSGQQISNAAFTVRGIAADNWQVTNVLYQLNGGGWNNAVTGNHWTNWNAPAFLTPGTNSIQVFAQDEGGNNSLTNTVNFAYIVSSRLQIHLNGLGTLSPNYSNTLLAVGQNYNITATPGSGFVFTNWTVSTNWVGGRIVNTANLPFTMASNLTLLADFVDVTRPTLTITAPTANQRMTNALAFVTGTASDNWKVAGVWYQFNSGAWTIAPTSNGWTNWNTSLTLPAGTNSLKAYALDLGGNYSLTSSVSFFSSNAFQLKFAFETNTPLAANGLHFDLLVSTNLQGHVQYSTNLQNWMTLTNFNGTNSTLKFNDSSATNGGPRFYRAVIP